MKTHFYICAGTLFLAVLSLKFHLLALCIGLLLISLISGLKYTIKAL